MKKIIFVKNLNEDNIDEVKSLLDETRAIYSIDVNNGAIAIEGSNDVVHACKVELNENGYQVY